MRSPLVQQLVKLSAAGVDRVRRPPRGLVVLIYHRVRGGSGLSVDLPGSLFDEQMAMLAGTSRVVSLDQALAEVAEPEAPPRDPIVITFDDGTRDFTDEVMPVIERYGLPVTLFVATHYVDRGIEFPHHGVPVTWSSLADAAATGLVTVGSHTHTHALLDRLEDRAIDDELDRSKGLIEDRLGLAANHFAYPKGLPGTKVADAAVRRRFRSAALAGTRPNRYGFTDVHRLSRSPVQVADGMRWFEHKVAGGMALEDDLRRIINRRRYTGATT